MYKNRGHNKLHNQLHYCCTVVHNLITIVETETVRLSNFG